MILARYPDPRDVPPKPRLSLVRGRWVCEGDQVRETGPEALVAYRNWRHRWLAMRDLERAIEEAAERAKRPVLRFSFRPAPKRGLRDRLGVVTPTTDPAG
jgi:GNAT superfamily N-acetyltransferase